VNSGWHRVVMNTPIVKRAESAMVTQTTKVSSLVELLRGRALQQPDQRIYTYLLDGEIEKGNLTFADLDCQARAIGAVLTKLRGERGACFTALSSGSGVHPCLLWMLICWSHFRSFASAEFGPAAADSPEASHHRKRCSAYSGADHIILSRAEVLFTQASELRRMRWLATHKVVGSAAQDWRNPGATRGIPSLCSNTPRAPPPYRGA
jgi:hypothetical protein